jgi:hypothetical protein
MSKRPASEAQLKEKKDPKKNKTTDDPSSSSSNHFEFHDAKPLNVKFDNKTGQTEWIDPVWDPRFTIGIFGSRGTGKSFLARWLCSMIYHFYPEVYVFTETKMNCYWAQMMNPQFIFEGYNRTVLSKILKNQENKVRLWREGKYKGNPLCLIIWDDCLPEDMNYDSDGCFKQIYFNGRHYFIGNIMNSQYFFKIPKRYRQNIDFVFSMMQESENQLTAFYNDFCYTGKGNEEAFGSRSLMNSFLRMFAKATADKGFILFSQRDKSVPNSERIYCGKAEDPGIFWMGSALYWSKNTKHLEKIKSGKAREEADMDLDEEKFRKWGIEPPSKDDANKGIKGGKKDAVKKK